MNASKYIFFRTANKKFEKKMIAAKIVSQVARTVLIGLPLVEVAPRVSANPKCTQSPS